MGEVILQYMTEACIFSDPNVVGVKVIAKRSLLDPALSAYDQKTLAPEAIIWDMDK